eukprot:TRINITY_DN8062_c0_g1_i3.p1 TRINITY_DN8062_c0_g1~~TRINITY_DN8062_c0_g1_i3.p1  ORF type:complete len:470 (+),score=74.73 TRINITY_DN8062_c0_g1_i3:47-1456(+)
MDLIASLQRLCEESMQLATSTLPTLLLFAVNAAFAFLLMIFQAPFLITRAWFSLLRSVFIFLKDLFIQSNAKRVRSLQRKQLRASSFRKWYALAQEIDEIQNVQEWRKQDQCDEYDWSLIQARLLSLREARARGDMESLSHLLRSGLMRNIGGISNFKLFSKSSITTKQLIDEYEKEVCAQLRYLCDAWLQDPGLSMLDKFDYFYETRQAFGRSALLLSGGAGFGTYHLGVVKTLFENKLLPRIIAGTSVGSLIASLVAVRTDEELPTLFQPGAINLDIFERLESKGSLRRKINRFITQGVLMDVTLLQECLRANIGDYTFQEVYDRTRRILNITASGTKKYNYPLVMNYLTTPNVLVWSAAVASCAVPGLFLPVELRAKDHKGRIVPYHISSVKWADGSLESDLPMERISELFNVTHFIVSQVNPHIIPFISTSSSERSLISMAFSLVKEEIRHRVAQVKRLHQLQQD